MSRMKDVLIGAAERLASEKKISVDTAEDLIRNGEIFGDKDMKWIADYAAGKEEDADDPINRQSAIDAVSKACEEFRGIFARCEKKLLALPSAQSETCAYWDRESNICALHRPSAQPDVPDRNVCNTEITDKAVQEYCRQRCLTILTNDYFYELTTGHPNWIPVTPKTLPKKAGDYLVTTHDGFVTKLLFIGNSEYWMRWVVAWMLLPEPYRPEGGEDD